MGRVEIPKDNEGIGARGGSCLLHYAVNAILLIFWSAVDIEDKQAFPLAYLPRDELGEDASLFCLCYDVVYGSDGFLD